MRSTQSVKQIVRLFLVVVGVFLFSGVANAQFNWGNSDGKCSGSGEFIQSLEEDVIAYVGEIPTGKIGILIKMSAQKDLDVQLYDKLSNDKIVAWSADGLHGILNGPSEASTIYESMNVEWSGYRGDCPNFNYGTEDYGDCSAGTSPGNEYIKVDETKRDLVMKAFAYLSGTARVEYSWTGTVDCVEGEPAKQGEGTFKQPIEFYDGDYEKTTVVGEIIPGLTDIYIGLKSKDDVDIRLYDEDGTEIIHWPTGALSGPNKQSIEYKGVKIEYSGYGGDCPTYEEIFHNSAICSFGHEYITIRGTTQNKFIMKAFGYRAGVASVDYSWGKFTIFTGIAGGNLLAGDLWDGGDGIKTWHGAQNENGTDKKIKELMAGAGLDCSHCMPRSISDMKRIAANNFLGGITAIAYNVANSVLSYSSFNTSGNTDKLKINIEKFYNANPNAKVFIVGHSTGGGDTQNLLWKLKKIKIPVEMSGHIDSVEIFSGDAKIPSNTKRAMGLYQNDGHILTRGESNLKAEDTSKTVVTNTRIDKPQGPANPNADSNAYHRNMDNDIRVWNTLLSYIKGKR